ncbi:MAG: TraR/DksA C4-type zinc finger protein [Burkholderiaceae bacterium]
MHCIDCGESIVAARLKLGKIRCIDCQTILEKQNRFFAQ